MTEQQAQELGYQTCPWPESKGGGFLMWKDGAWILVGCRSKRWREAWGCSANVETGGDIRTQPGPAGNQDSDMPSTGRD